MKRTRLAIAGALLIVILAQASMASAAIRIYKIQFDPPGSDTGSKKSLNQEYVVIQNTGRKGVTLTGWKLKDAAGHTFQFPTFRLGQGRKVTVHTGPGGQTQTDLHWGSGAYIWNNDGDTASLRRRDGSLVDRCRYSGAGSSVLC